MFIYIARHAWAGHFGDPGWADDSLRELEPEGVERYARLVETLAQRGFEPDIVATSPYVRCRQTAEIIAQHTPRQPEVVELDALTPGSDFEATVAWSVASDAGNICWVGHAPDVGIFTSALIGRQRGHIRFAKGGIAAVRMYDEIGYACGELYWHVTAKVLGV